MTTTKIYTPKNEHDTNQMLVSKKGNMYTYEIDIHMTPKITGTTNCAREIIDIKNSWKL